MKSLVLYKTMYGSTREYARWIAKEINADIYDIKKALKIDFNGYDNLIVGSYIFAFSLPVSDFIIKKWDSLKDKNIFIFTVSAIDPEKYPDRISFISKKGFPREIRKKMNFFHFPGRYIINKFNIIHRILIKIGARTIEDLTERQNMLESSDNVNKSFINNLVSKVKNINYDNEDK